MVEPNPLLLEVALSKWPPIRLSDEANGTPMWEAVEPNPVRTVPILDVDALKAAADLAAARSDAVPTPAMTFDARS
jgi:hypothetical protein